MTHSCLAVAAIYWKNGPSVLNWLVACIAHRQTGRSHQRHRLRHLCQEFQLLKYQMVLGCVQIWYKPRLGRLSVRVVLNDGWQRQKTVDEREPGKRRAGDRWHQWRQGWSLIMVWQRERAILCFVVSCDSSASPGVIYETAVHLLGACQSGVWPLSILTSVRDQDHTSVWHTHHESGL